MKAHDGISKTKLKATWQKQQDQNSSSATSKDKLTVFLIQSLFDCQIEIQPWWRFKWIIWEINKANKKSWLWACWAASSNHLKSWNRGQRFREIESQIVNCVFINFPLLIQFVLWSPPELPLWLPRHSRNAMEGPTYKYYILWKLPNLTDL